jgi:hypothetical protein
VLASVPSLLSWFASQYIVSDSYAECVRFP